MPETFLAQKLSTVGFFLRPLWSFVANYKLIPLCPSGLHIPLSYVQARLKNKCNYNLSGTLCLLDCTEVTPQTLTVISQSRKSAWATLACEWTRLLKQLWQLFRGHTDGLVIPEIAGPHLHNQVKNSKEGWWHKISFHNFSIIFFQEGCVKAAIFYVKNEFCQLFFIFNLWKKIWEGEACYEEKNTDTEIPIFQYKAVLIENFWDFFSRVASSSSDFLHVSGQVTSFLWLSSIFESG